MSDRIPYSLNPEFSKKEDNGGITQKYVDKLIGWMRKKRMPLHEVVVIQNVDGCFILADSESLNGMFKLERIDFPYIPGQTDENI